MNRLKQARHAARLTQMELAAALGVRRLTVTRWEGGKTRPSLNMLERIAAALNTTVGALLDEPDAPAEGAA